ncbi:tRNA lysidine(34) synthetase TilS [Deinococcus metallilatus]|uniref:Multifunctional fusion protein n=1 Tax=Deinococcus metallilatus TaxID=1211322 RepID=A0AAJ5F2P4_9DEIO|nr:tRNA lysidine(34) synthetase TilS [Deinococcus metallilatus]MBB5295130.1 tRNA(Ile)-lysidine synthase [Deinococcus metallilatus]QBY08691.1 tRNA lysidine(34) synthetase TilS [Deinococcus metallilatus]RXJ10570.1 tRNA lysidine(34) synthetase TilS [Deinococcus metallilatus]TLK26541.1 tRNA lysidine(34) synthetase TilS [Deinococcus metallilatus]GMA14903.1 tRNA(Ile)-lysidine synthase [Deinococcus metallilatus]
MPALLTPLEPYAGQTVVLGVSGGADSVALLRALVLAGAQPVAAHLDHALRPDSAEDAAWVRELAEKLDVPFEETRVDVAAVAARRGWNLEDAARRVRYEFLGRVAKRHGASAILTAHTRRDQAETVLLQLLRGEAVLNGIPPARGRVRRPWLDVPRADLEAFLHALGQDWREDPTNADPSQTRAWLRTVVLPLLAARFPDVEAALARVARLAREDDGALTELAARLTAHAPLADQPPAVLRRHVAQALTGADLPYHTGHVERLAAALGTGETAHVTLPGARDVTVTGGRLHLTPQVWSAPDFPIPGGWTLRTRQPGDRVRLPGGTRKLSDVLGGAKVPREARDRVPLLAVGAEVRWVGLRPPLWAVGAREEAGVPEDLLHAAMGEALKLAHEAARVGEVPVGAVVLGPGGTIVGRGRNTSREHGDMTRHAELAALREAAQTLGTPYLTDCTLVVTLEPCPMCLGAALEARVGRVVYGARNPKAGALGGVSDLLASHWGHRPAVTGGVRAGEAARLLRDTFRGLRGEVEPETP